MRRAVAFGVGVAALLPFLRAGVAHADDTSSLEGLLERDVVVAASRSAEQATDAPAFSRNISADDMRRFGVRSLDEALLFLGVGIRPTQSLVGPEITARGVAITGDRGDHVLLLIDGHVVNEPLYGSARFGQGLGVPFELVDHVEVILGPGSVTYGSSAMLAVINVVTKSAHEHSGTFVTVEASPFTMGRASLTGGYSFDFFGKRTGLTAGVSYYRKDGPDLAFAPQNVGIDPTTLQPARFSPVGPGTGVWGGRVVRDNFADVPTAYLRIVRDRLEIIGRASHVTFGTPGSDGDFDQLGNRSTDQRVNLSVRQGVSIGEVGEASVRVFADFFELRDSYVSSRFLCQTSFQPCLFGGNSRSSRLGAELSGAFDWWSDGSFATVLNASASLSHVGYRTWAHDYATGVPVVDDLNSIDVRSSQLYAASAQQTWRPLSWLTLSAGLRGDLLVVHNEYETRTTPVFSPRFAISTRPWEGATLKAVYATAFRAPSLYESDGKTPLLIRASSLEPERVRSKELIFEQSVQAQRLSFGVFDTTYSGIIHLKNGFDIDGAFKQFSELPAGSTSTSESYFPIQQYQNDDRIRTRGFTATYDGVALRGRVRFGGSFTGAVARADGVELVSVAPQVFGNARASYDFGGKLPTLALAGAFAGRAAADKAYDAGFTPVPMAPAALDLRATLTGLVPCVKGLSYRVIVNRAFHDRAPYAVGPTTQPQAGITQPLLSPIQRWNVTVGLQYAF